MALAQSLQLAIEKTTSHLSTMVEGSFLKETEGGGGEMDVRLTLYPVSPTAF